QLGGQVGFGRARVVHDLRLEAAGDAAEHVDQAVDVRRHEVDGRLGQTQLLDRPLDRLPPAARAPGVADVRAAHHAHRQLGLVPAGVRQGGLEVVAPRVPEPAPVVLAGLRGDAYPLGVGADLAYGAVQLVPLDLEGHQRGYEVVDVGGGGE